MNSLILLPLLAAACIAAPGNLHHTYAAAPAVVAAPAVTYTAAHVQVPVHQTVHYDVKNVVTGYTSQIIKPAISAHALPIPQVVSPIAVAPVPVAPAPAVVAEPAPVAVAAPAPAPVPIAPAPAPVAPAPAEIASDDTVLVENPEFRSAAPAAIAPAPAAVYHNYNYAAAVVHAPAVVTYAAPAPAVVHAPAPAPVVHYAGPLVTKEQVLAPVRTHTRITPQVTQVQPEVTVRKVIQDVAVDTPVYHTPVIHKTHVAPQQIHHTYAAVAPAPAIVHHAAPAIVKTHHTYAAAPAPLIHKVHY